MKKLITIAIPLFIVHIILLLLLNYQCDKRAKSKQLNEKEFVQVYCDVVTYKDVVDSRLREAFVDSVLSSYKISRDEFQYTVEAYSKNDKKWERVFTKIVEELERRENEMRAESDSIKIR